MDGPSDIRAGVESCCGHIYHKGLLQRSFSKKALEVVEVPHPDDLLLHSLASIDPPLLFTRRSKYSRHNFGDKMILFVSLKESFITHLDVSCLSTCRIDLQSSRSAVTENFQLSTAPRFSTYNTCIGAVIGLKSSQVWIGGLKAVWWINQAKELHCLFIDMGT